MKHTCEYCHKEFTKESTLLTHVCEPKRRWLQKNEPPVRLGFIAYNSFYSINSVSSKKPKTYEDFAESNYYNAFVKLGRYLNNIKSINPESYIKWLIRNQKKLDYWTKDSFYNEWLIEYLRLEDYGDALSRSIGEMDQWATSNNAVFTSYFELVSTNIVIQAIDNGRISPWVIYNCATGTKFLSKLSEQEIGMIYDYIDPDFWYKKFITQQIDTDIVKDILNKAGLN